MSEDERLNEEAARNNNTPPSWTPDDILYINKKIDEKKQLPNKKGKKRD